MVLLLVFPAILQETVGGHAARLLLLRLRRSLLALPVFIGHVKRPHADKRAMLRMAKTVRTMACVPP